jgi:alpha-N-arabinofuranosidase
MKRLVFIALLAVTSIGMADESGEYFSNPIIPGFAPDPSIVRVGEDFYLINSTFEYFPGIPVYHSTDLINWELISYALHDSSQAELSGLKSSDGIHASTIRHHDGLFYVITTNNVDGNMANFIVTAEDPSGPWSAPYVLEGAPGIDPSLFFDDDGRVWYVGNHMPPDPEFDGQAEIWLQELDLDRMQLKGERHYLWRGCCGGVWAEGPHIYKKDGYYYLLISEGGTAYEHALAVATSKEITGPYQNNPRNPVLSHRQLSYDTPITGVGHADIVELEDGRWYAVALGWRLVDGRHGILGRETFLVPMTWETEPYTWKKEKMTWPVFSPATGRVDPRFPVPYAGTTQERSFELIDEFWPKDRAPCGSTCSRGRLRRGHSTVLLAFASGISNSKRSPGSGSLRHAWRKLA